MLMTVLVQGDMFIDNIIKVFVGFPDVIKRHAASTMLTAHVLMRPSAGNKEPIPRKEIISLDKLHVKGMTKEEQTVLGWLIKTRRMLLNLPEDKFIIWTDELSKVIKASSKT